jgi:hypothetical protein
MCMDPTTDMRRLVGKMRILIAMSVYLAVTCLAIAQQPNTVRPTVSDVLDRMTSKTWTERSNAFSEATDLMGSADTSAGDIDRLRLAIIQLLVHENNGGLKEPDNVAPENYTEGYGEDKAEYYAGLISFVAELNDERAIPALLGAAGSGGMATRAVARFGKRALDPTLTQLKSQNSDLASGASFVVMQILKLHTTSDSDSHLRIKDALKSALVSPDYRTRANAMYPVEYLDDREEFVAILQDIAAHDSYKSPYYVTNEGKTVGGDYLVRRHAQLLLHKIESHEEPAIDRGQVQ